MKTYRYRGHSRTDPAKYRPEGELERWKERDPIAILAARLVEAGALTAEEREGIWDETRATLDAAAARAELAPYPTLEEAMTLVYADRTA
jgi:pyruvate dehydrogenase E1 component alpha subunit